MNPTHLRQWGNARAGVCSCVHYLVESTSNSLGPNLGLRRDVLADEAGQAETEAGPQEEQKSPGKPAISAVFQGKDEKDPKWRRRELNPRPVVLQRKLLRV